MPEYIKHGEGTFSALTRQQKEAVGLLSIGTFLEYFDLMLYIHMAVLLNELFFPKADPHTQAIYSALAFCSTYALRPLGALIFGWIGDNIGRKNTVVITTFMMAVSCVVMANLPSYDQVGIIATYVITMCRIIQGMSSMGEIIGAELYLTEITKPPVQYPVVSSISVCSALGGMFALGIASLVISLGINWRTAFWFGALIAIIGIVARMRLRETPDFVDARRRLQRSLQKIKQNTDFITKHIVYQEKVKKLTVMSLFLIWCAWPISFYFTYIYCGNILKVNFSYSAEQVINHNFILSIVALCSCVILTYLSYIVYPLRILKIKLIIFLLFLPFCPYLINQVNTPYQLFLIQSFIVLFSPSDNTAVPIFYKYFPVFKRFTYSSLIYAISRTLVVLTTTFGVVWLVEYFNIWGILIILLPSSIGFAFGLYHFDKLEKIQQII